VAYFMVSVDKPEDNKAFAEQEQADFPMLSDPGMSVADAYGVLPPPNPANPSAPRYARRWMFFIDGNGKILHIETQGHTADAGTYLAKQLEELGVKKK
jgi:peroxiredoxin Q/BCP